MKLYQSKLVKNLRGESCVSFSLTGNGQFGNVIRIGWEKSSLVELNQKRIIRLLQEGAEVVRRGGRYYAIKNGVEAPILGTKGGLKLISE